MASSRPDRGTENADLADLFQDALRAYQAETKRDLQLDELQKKLKTSEDLLTYIEAQGKSFQNFRNRHGKLWTRMHAVLQPIATIGTLTQTAINPVPTFGPPISAVLGAVLYLVTAANGVKDAYDLIYTLFGEFETFAIRLQEYTSGSHDLNPALRNQLNAILRCMFRVCGRAEALVKAGRFREYLRTGFLGKDDKTKDLVDELNTQLKNEGSLVMTLTFNAAGNSEAYSKSAAGSGKRIEQQLEELKLSNAEFASRFHEQMQQDVSGREIREMKQMLENPAVSRVTRLLSTQKRELVDETGTWLEREAHFGEWRGGGFPILWVLGGPGSGKSFLATWAIQHLQEYFNRQIESSSVTAVAYFFVKDYDTSLVDAHNILKTWALQIAEVDLTFGRYAASCCRDRTATITEDDVWESLFVGFYSSIGATNHHAVLILDGLDEAPAQVRKKILAMVKSITTSKKHGRLGEHIQFGVFGRSNLQGDFEFSQQDKIIEVSLKNQDDIKTFILSKMSEIKLVRFEESKGSMRRKQARQLRNTITKKVLHNADGIFLSAKLHMEELEELNAVQMGRALENPPQSLDGMISQLFERIVQDGNVDSIQVSRMMLFICFARHPLLFGELELFLSLPDRPPDVLLWYNIRGRFASLFETKYPDWYLLDSIGDDGYNEAKEGSVVNEYKALTETSTDGDAMQEDNYIARGADPARNHDDGGDDVGSDHDHHDNVLHDSNGDEDEDEDEDEDYDFGDQSDVDTNTHAAKNATTDDEDAEEHASTIHDKGQLMTSIRFTHQRIKDFLTDDDNGSTKPSLPNGIHVNVQRAEIDMVISCLQALQLCNKKKEYQKYSADYAAKHFVLHLANVQEDHLMAEDTKEIISGLVNLFSSDQASRIILVATTSLRKDDTGLDSFWKMWINCQTHRETVQRWLRKPEIETVVTDQEVLRWVHRAKTSPVALLEPLMSGISRIWLTKTGHDDEGYRDTPEWIVDLLRAYVSMDESGAVTDKDFQNWSRLHHRWYPPASFHQIYEVAEWASLEKTSHWYTGVAWVLMTFKLYDEAITECDKALALDPKAWMAMETKARSLGSQKQLEEAAVIMAKAIANVPPSLDDVSSALYEWIADWKAKLGDEQGAHEAATKGFEFSSGSTAAEFTYITTLFYVEHSFQKLVDVLAQLHKVKTKSGCSKLVLFLSSHSEMYDKIGLACRECETPAFVLEAIDQALEWSQDKASKQQRVMMMTRAAQILHHYYSLNEKAIEYYENALMLASKGPSDADEEEDLQDRLFVRNELSLALFDMAVASKKADKGYSQLTSRLRELSMALDSSMDYHSFEFYETDYTSLLWGRWLREHEGCDETIWRQPFRAGLLDQINMLDDDIPGNDSSALKAVAKSLFHAGDRENASATFAILFKLLEDYVKERHAQPTEIPVAVDQNLGNGAIKAQEQTEEGLAEIGSGNEIISHSTMGSERAQPAVEAAVSEPSASAGSAVTKHTASTVADDGANFRMERTPLKLTINNYDWVWGCEHCDRESEEVAELYFCEVCSDANWCDECLPLLQNGEIRRHGCNPDHSFYRAWPIPEEARHIAVTWLESEPRLKKEWLEALRARWQ